MKKEQLFDNGARQWVSNIKEGEGGGAGEEEKENESTPHTVH